MAIILPKPNEIIPAKRTSPRVLLLYAEPKVGKTELCLALKDSLLLDLNDEGSDFAAGTKVTVRNLEELTEIGKEIIKQKYPYKYLILDTAGDLVDWCEADGTVRYKNSPQGQNYKGSSVLDLGHGYGYRWQRISYGIYFECLRSWASECLIILAHVKDKVLTNKEGKEVAASDINLTGQLREITCAKADAIGYLYRKNGKEVTNGRVSEEIWVSFQSSMAITGSRAKHLAGQDFLFSKVVDVRKEPVIAEWNKIFLKEETK